MNHMIVNGQYAPDEKRIMKDCPDCNGEGKFNESECCGAEIKWTDICTNCGEHTNETTCETCGGLGEVEMNEDEILDLKNNIEFDHET
jgi:DnaJ-class molecular chaperone